MSLLSSQCAPCQEGHPVRAGQPEPVNSSGAPFLGNVPDFVQADWVFVSPWTNTQKRGRRPVLHGVRWAIHQAVIIQQSSAIVIPDVLLGQVVWGGDRKAWPKNWRSRLIAYFKMGKAAITPPDNSCTELCPLWDADIRHTHWTIRISERFLGVMERFGYDGEEDERIYDWTDPPEYRHVTGPSPEDASWEANLIDEPLDGDETESVLDKELERPMTEKIKEDRKAGRLVAVYFPVLLFGYSPCSGLRDTQRELLIALTREITRTAKSRREDKARVVGGGRATADERDPCPDLPNERRYIAFNGNGSYKRKRLRGHGYRLIGKSRRGWLARAGYAIPMDSKGQWKQVQRFLKDLSALVEPFGLIVAGWHGKKQQWRSLAELIELTKTKAGRRWLERCLLRVYTEDDYLSRWRRYFAKQLGFSVIPGDGDAGVALDPVTEERFSITSAVELDQWMRQNQLTDAAMAQALGVSRSWIAKQRTGSRPWSIGFQQRLSLWNEERRRESGWDDGPSVTFGHIKSSKKDQKVTSNTPESTNKSHQIEWQDDGNPVKNASFEISQSTTKFYNEVALASGRRLR